MLRKAPILDAKVSPNQNPVMRATKPSIIQTFHQKPFCRTFAAEEITGEIEDWRLKTGEDQSDLHPNRDWLLAFRDSSPLSSSRVSQTASSHGQASEMSESSARTVPSVLAWTPHKGFFFFDSHSHSFFRIDHGYASRLTRPPSSNVFSAFDSVSASGMAYYDPEESLLFCDPSFHIVRSISLKKADYGLISTFAGKSNNKKIVEGHKNGKLAHARFSSPFDVVVSPWSDILISDSGNHVVRIVKEGKVIDLAGRAEKRGFKDGPKLAAMFDRPLGMAVGVHGEVFVCDNGNRRVRMIEATANGQVKTIAGNGEDGLCDGEHLTAKLGNPMRIKVTARGDLICLSHNLRIIQERGGVSTLWQVSKPYHITTETVSSITRKKKTVSQRVRDVLGMKLKAPTHVAVKSTVIEQETIFPSTPTSDEEDENTEETKKKTSDTHQGGYHDNDKEKNASKKQKIDPSSRHPHSSSKPADHDDTPSQGSLPSQESIPSRMDRFSSNDDSEDDDEDYDEDEYDWHPSDAEMPRDICDFFIDANGDLFYTDLGTHFNYLQMYGNFHLGPPPASTSAATPSTAAPPRYSTLRSVDLKDNRATTSSMDLANHQNEKSPPSISNTDSNAHNSDAPSQAVSSPSQAPQPQSTLPQSEQSISPSNSNVLPSSSTSRNRPSAPDPKHKTKATSDIFDSEGEASHQKKKKRKKEKVIVVNIRSPVSDSTSVTSSQTASGHQKKNNKHHNGHPNPSSPLLRRESSSFFAQPPPVPSTSSPPFAPVIYECAKIKVIKGANALIYPLKRERYQGCATSRSSFAPVPSIDEHVANKDLHIASSSIAHAKSIDTNPASSSMGPHSSSSSSSLKRSISSSVLVPRDPSKGSDCDFSTLLSPGNVLSDFSLVLPIAEGGTETWKLHSIVVFLACPSLLSMRTIASVERLKLPSSTITALVEYIYRGLLPSTRRQGPLFWTHFSLLADAVSLHLVRQYACLRLYQSLVLHNSLSLALRCVAEAGDAKFVFETVCDFLAHFLPPQISRHALAVKSKIYETIHREGLYDLREKAEKSRLNAPPVIAPRIDPTSRMPVTPDLHGKDDPAEADLLVNSVLKLNPAVPFLVDVSLSNPSVMAMRISMLARRFRGNSPLRKWNRVDPFGVIDEEVLTLGAWLSSGATTLSPSSSAPSSASNGITLVPFTSILQPDWFLRLGKSNQFVACHSCILYARWPWFRDEIEKKRQSALASPQSHPSSHASAPAIASSQPSPISNQSTGPFQSATSHQPLSQSSPTSIKTKSTSFSDISTGGAPKQGQQMSPSNLPAPDDQRLPFSPAPFEPYVSIGEQLMLRRLLKADAERKAIAKKTVIVHPASSTSSAPVPPSNPPPLAPIVPPHPSTVTPLLDSHWKLPSNIGFPSTPSKYYKRLHCTVLPDDRGLTHAYVQGLVWYLYSGEVSQVPKGEPISSQLFAELGFTSADSKIPQGHRDDTAPRTEDKASERQERRKQLSSLNWTSSTSEFETSSESFYETEPGTFFDALQEHNRELVDRPLTVDNAIPALLFARQHTCKDRYMKCVVFLSGNLNEILSRPELRKELHALPEAEYSAIIQLATVSLPFGPPENAPSRWSNPIQGELEKVKDGDDHEKALDANDAEEAEVQARRGQAQVSPPFQPPLQPPTSSHALKSASIRSNNDPTIASDGRRWSQSGNESEIASTLLASPIHPPPPTRAGHGDLPSTLSPHPSPIHSSLGPPSTPLSLSSAPTLQYLRTAQLVPRPDDALEDFEPNRSHLRSSPPKRPSPDLRTSLPTHFPPINTHPENVPSFLTPGEENRPSENAAALNRPPTQQDNTSPHLSPRKQRNTPSFVGGVYEFPP